MGDYRKGFLLSLLVVVFFACLLRFPIDDGLRHISFAVDGERAWGDAYPYSYFETFRDYDPWFGYDVALREIALVLSLFPFSRLHNQFILAKAILFIFLLAFLYLVLARSGILEEITDGYSFSLAYILLFIVLFYSMMRVSLIRPFVLGTLYLIYTVGKTGIGAGIASSVGLLYIYPYLAWFYTIPAGVCHFLRGDKRFGLATISITVLFLAFQPPSFWGLQVTLFESDSVRALLDKKITEFAPAASHLSLYAFYLAGLLALLPSCSKNARRLNYPNLLIILYLLPSLKYVRYMLDIVLPLVFVSFGREALRVALHGFHSVIDRWAEAIPRALKPGSNASVQPGKAAGGMTLKPLIAILYAVVFGIMILHNQKQFLSTRKVLASLSDIPAGSMVLTDFSTQYKALYARPDLRLVPSCEIGFPQDGIEKEYFEFFNQGKVCTLAQKIKARFFVESGRLYLYPGDVQCLRRIKTSKDIRVWEVVYPLNNRPVASIKDK